MDVRVSFDAQVYSMKRELDLGHDLQRLEDACIFERVSDILSLAGNVGIELPPSYTIQEHFWQLSVV